MSTVGGLGVSAAEITHAGPFSRFDGMDHTAVLIQGQRLQLERGGQRLVFEAPGHSQRFSGEQQLHAVVPADQSVRLWNVMTRRGHATAQVEVHRAGMLVLAAGAPACCSCSMNSTSCAPAATRRSRSTPAKERRRRPRRPVHRLRAQAACQTRVLAI